MIVSVFDPGGHTGFVTAQLDKRVSQGFKLLEYGYFVESDRVDELVRASRLVVSERLTFGRNLAFNPIGIEVMGAIKQSCHLHTVPLQWQPPSLMKPAITWGLIHEHEFTSEHPKDALCHFAMFLRRTGRLEDPRGTDFSVRGIKYTPDQLPRYKH